MKVTHCVTLSFFLISHASQHTPTSSASPLPPSIVHRRELLGSSPQATLNDEHTSHIEYGEDTASIASVNSEPLDRHRLPAASGHISASLIQITAAFNLDEYPYPTITKTPKRSRTKPSRHSMTQVEALGSTSTAPGTLFVTPYSPAPSQSVQHGTLSPLRPLYEAGRSPMVATVSPPQASALPWVLGFLIPVTLGLSMCLGVRRNRKNKPKAVPQPITPHDSYSSKTTETGTTLSAEKTGLGIRFEGTYNTSAMLSLPPVNAQPMNMDIGVPITCGDGRQIQETMDRFELKTAVFPTRSELGHYVFPATAAAVEREVQAGKRTDSEKTTHTAPFPTAFSIPRNLIANRPALSLSKRVAPKTFGSRIQTAQRKRFSPLGDVLYSTGGADEPLETVHEETTANDLDVLRTPKAAYKGGEGEFASGPQNEAIPLASATSYGVSNSPLGLRARRRSSPMIPEVVFSGEDWSPTFSTEHTGIVAPLQISKGKRLSSNHRQSATKSEIFASTNMLGKPLMASASLADEEERKFAEFLRTLVWKEHSREKRSHGIQESVSGMIDLSMISGKPEELSHAGRPILLPAPSFGAALSDFGVSSSTLASEVPSSSSRFSVGVAL